MNTLYVSVQGCYLCLEKDLLVVKRGNQIINKIQLPLTEQVLIFGKSQITTQAIRACLWRNIPIVYLSRMGYCYGRTIAIERGYRQLSRYQQQLSFTDKLITARAIIKTKLINQKVILQRRQKLRDDYDFSQCFNILNYLIDKSYYSDNLRQNPNSSICELITEHLVFIKPSTHLTYIFF